MQKRVFVGVLLVTILLNAITSLSSAVPLLDAGDDGDLAGVSVAVYESYNAFYVNESRTALVSMFTWMNASVTVIDKEDILTGELWNYEILSVPEGLGPFIENKLGDDAEQEIREWVAAGGSYVGVRGSAAIAVNKSYYEGVNSTFKLGLVNGTSNEVTGLPGFAVVEIALNHEIQGLDLSNYGGNITMLFETGRWFEADEGQQISIIGNYSHSGLPAIIAADYGQGNCFLSSPHFEFEEDSNRDGTDYLDVYDDPTSEWPFMLTVMHWLLDTSASVTVTVAPPPVELLIAGVAIGTVAVVGLGYVIRKRT